MWTEVVQVSSEGMKRRKKKKKTNQTGTIFACYQHPATDDGPVSKRGRTHFTLADWTCSTLLQRGLSSCHSRWPSCRKAATAAAAAVAHTHVLSWTWQRTASPCQGLSEVLTLLLTVVCLLPPPSGYFQLPSHVIYFSEFRSSSASSSSSSTFWYGRSSREANEGPTLHLVSRLCGRGSSRVSRKRFRLALHPDTHGTAHCTSGYLFVVPKQEDEWCWITLCALSHDRLPDEPLPGVFRYGTLGSLGQWSNLFGAYFRFLLLNKLCVCVRSFFCSLPSSFWHTSIHQTKTLSASLRW